ncbi:MAG: hypothetical protein ACLTDX_24680 [[Clostridium] innocuum]
MGERILRVYCSFYVNASELWISSLAIFFTTILFQRPLVTLFTDMDSVYGIALQGFVIFAFSLLFSGFNIFSSAMFTALSQGRLSALISFSRTFGFICCFCCFFQSGWGAEGCGWLFAEGVPCLYLYAYSGIRLPVTWQIEKRTVCIRRFYDAYPDACASFFAREDRLPVQ